ncbi:unnamed protein product [Brassica napus]|uniref:(rape) hypothetical protein n=1 Tax=Brassica napus TaxID=3708 RepID=A0A816JAQ4_BRANA|nr:unnamed protein product [Brassica napus]
MNFGYAKKKKKKKGPTKKIIKDKPIYIYYWHRVNESQGFDIEGILGPKGMVASGQLVSYKCEVPYPFRQKVKCYGKLGLHRYNLIQGTNFELQDLIKFNMRDFGYLNVVCSVARIKGGDTTGGASETTGVFALPNWPSDAEIQRLYTVDRSELLSTHWILLYLELVLCIEYGYGNFSEDKVSSLELVKVAIDTDDETPLQAKSSVLYIAFRGLAIDGTDESVERKAVIKSLFNELTGSLALQGILCNGETPMGAEEYFKFVYI